MPELRPFDQPRGELLLLGAATVLGLLLRLVGLGAESIWEDEFFSLWMTSLPTGDLLRGDYPDAHPPGYYLLLQGWLALFGRTVEAARALSAVTALVLIPATWALAHAAGLGVRLRLAAAALVAVSPPLVYLGREIRNYALMAAMATVVAWAVVRIGRPGDVPPGERGKRPVGPWLTFVLGGAACLYVHYYAFLLLGAAGLLLLWLRRRDGWRGITPVLLAGFAIAVAFLPWLPAFLHQYGKGYGARPESWLQHLGYFPAYLLVGHTLVWKEHGVLLLGLVWVACAGVLALPLLARRPGLPTRALLPAILGLLVCLEAVAISLVRKPIFNGRYMSLVFPCLLVGLVVGYAALRRARPRLAAAGLAVLGLLLAASLARLYAAQHKNDWRSVAAHTAAVAPALPLVAVRGYGNGACSWYRPEAVYRRLNPEKDPSGRWRPQQGPDATVLPAEFWLLSKPWTASPGTGSPEADLHAWLSTQHEEVGRRAFEHAVLTRWRRRQ